MQGKPTPPEGVQLNELSAAVFDALSEHTVFPWPVLKTQAKRFNIDPTSLSPQDLERLIDRLANGVARFTSPEAGVAVEQQLRALLPRR